MSADEAEVDDAIRSLLDTYTVPPMAPPSPELTTHTPLESIPQRKRRKRKRIIRIHRPTHPFSVVNYRRLVRREQERALLESINEILFPEKR
jgi:hypothetical protein